MSDDLIKRSDAIAEIYKVRTPDVASHHYAELFINAVCRAPSADRPEGEWIEGKYDLMCSNCENTQEYEKFPYCPYCGAKMADRKTESDSEKPNNSTCSKMEQVDKDINVRSKDEPQYDFGAYADRLWKIAYERGKREALEQAEPSCDTCKLKDTTEWCKRQEVCRAYQPKDEQQTERSE